MSDDRINVAVLEDFVKKVRLASKGGQKELRIPIVEAENLVHNLSIVTLKLLDKQQSSTKAGNEELITITMDGGNL
jgi:hypothetical protein